MPEKHCAQPPTTESFCFLKEIFECLQEQHELVCMLLGSPPLFLPSVCKWLRNILREVHPPLNYMIGPVPGMTLLQKRKDIRDLSKCFGITGMILKNFGSEPGEVNLREVNLLFAEILACQQLTRIDFDMYTTELEIIRMFLNLFRGHGLEWLKFNCYLEGKEDLDQRIAQWLASLRELRKLDLRIAPQPGSRGPGFKELLRGIDNCKELTHITLCDMRVNDDDVEKFTENCSRMSKLVSLKLSKNNITKSTVERLLRCDSRFSELDFSGNPLGHHSVVSLIPAFLSLRILNLGDTNIGTPDVLKLAENANLLDKLEHLDISHNKINAQAGPAIVQLLRQCTKLKHLNLRSNSLGGAFNDEMCRAIASSNLRFLSIRDNNLSDQELDRFYQFLRDNGDRAHWISLR